MDNRQLSLESRLLQLRDEIKALEASALPPERLRATLQKLCAERAQLEAELINLVVSPDNDTRSEAWVGLREGLLATVQSLAETLRDAQRKTEAKPAPQESLLTRAFSFLAKRSWTAWGAALLFVYVLLIAMAALGTGFEGLFGGPERARELFETYAGNPFVGLLAGLLVTAIIQSSSVTTSVIVGLCVGGLPIHVAIPMVMGANIGTSVTNTLVSLGHIGHRREFRRAFAAATIHDFFNITAVCLFLPTELLFHWLERLSGLISGALYGSAGFNMDSINFVAAATAPVERALHGLFLLIPNAKAADGLYVVFGLVVVFAAILLLGKLLRLLFTGRAERVFRTAVGKNPVAAIGSGFAITALVQSSSTTTSLIVPLAGAGLMKLKQAFPFTLGANIGTCVTALLAALAFTGAGAQFGLQIALVHLLFNTCGVILIYGLPPLRRVPLVCASSLAKLACDCRPLAIVYIVGVFFLLPVVCLALYRLLG
mgnify:CR=1 FL=1